jgi:hypothetical protein
MTSSRHGVRSTKPRCSGAHAAVSSTVAPATRHAVEGLLSHTGRRLSCRKAQW